MREKFGKYSITEQVGQGSRSTVYRALDTSLNRQVALKIYHPHLLNNTQFVNHIQSEAKIIASLDHPNIISIYDFGMIESRIFIAMTFASKKNLATHLQDYGRSSWNKTLDIIHPLLDALDYAHKNQVVHGDLKPENIVFLNPSRPMIADFGTSRILSHDLSLSTAEERFVGTPSYMSPEIWEGKAISKSADIYAFGCIIYEMLTGKKLFPGNNMVQIMRAHLQGPQFPIHWETDIPSALPSILKIALSSDSEGRFPAPGDFWRALKNINEEKSEVKSVSNINSITPTEPFAEVNTHTEGIEENKIAQHISSKKGITRRTNNGIREWYGVLILALTDSTREVTTALKNIGYKITSKQETSDKVIITAEQRDRPLILFRNTVLIELQISTIVYETDLIITSRPALNASGSASTTTNIELILTEIEEILK